MDGLDKFEAERVVTSGDIHKSPDRTSQVIFRSIEVTNDRRVIMTRHTHDMWRAAIHRSQTIGEFETVDIDQWVFEFRERDECFYGIRGKLVDGRYTVQHG